MKGALNMNVIGIFLILSGVVFALSWLEARLSH